MLDKNLLKLLRCPLTDALLIQEGDVLIARVDGDAPKYPIIGGRPVLIPDAAMLPEGVTAAMVRARHAPTGAATGATGAKSPT